MGNEDWILSKQENLEMKHVMEACNKPLSIKVEISNECCDTCDVEGDTNIETAAKVDEKHSVELSKQQVCTEVKNEDYGTYEDIMRVNGETVHNVDLNLIKLEDVEVKQEIEACDEHTPSATDTSKVMCDIFEPDPDTNVGMSLKAEREDDVGAFKLQAVADVHFNVLPLLRRCRSHDKNQSQLGLNLKHLLQDELKHL